jgi:hypothetical protein
MEMFYFRGYSAKFCQAPPHIAILRAILPCHLAVWQNSANHTRACGLFKPVCVVRVFNWFSPLCNNVIQVAFVGLQLEGDSESL